MTVTIPSTVTTIGNYAFQNCSYIDNVYCDANPDNLTIGLTNTSFKEDKGTKFVVPPQYLEAYKSKFADINATIVTDEKCGDNAYCRLIDSDNDGTADKLSIKGTGPMWDFEYDYDLGTYTTPWYEERDNITSVVIDDNITTMGRRNRCT